LGWLLAIPENNRLGWKGSSGVFGLFVRDTEKKFHNIDTRSRAEGPNTFQVKGKNKESLLKGKDQYS
jgi:hypothetical protein